MIPIRGRLDDPQIQLWPTVLGVVRNAFVEGITGLLVPAAAGGPEEGRVVTR